MAPIRLLATGLSLFLVAFAGCTGGGGGKELPPQTSAAEPTVDADSGAVHGFVTDDQVAAVKGAGIAITALGLATTTDDNGEFTLNDVPPGLHDLFVSRIGYESKGQRVEVAAAEVTEVRISLLPIAVAEPFHDSIPFSGQFQCSLALFDVLWQDCGVETTSAFYFEKPQGVRHLVGELRWTSASAGTGQNLDFNLVKGTSVEDTESTQWYANTFGPSPLMIHVTVGEQFENPDSAAAVGASDQDQVVDDEDTKVGFNIYSSPTYVADQALVGLTLEQKFNGYVTLFYDMDVPEGFSAFADG